MEERRVILIGKTGNGKSSTGNWIFQQKIFNAESSAAAVTQECEMQSTKINDRTYSICDTPGLLDAGVNVLTRALQVQESVKICPQAHVFLLVFSSCNRMTEDEKYTIDLLRMMFGERVFEHCIVVFTRGDEFDDDTQFEEFWKKSDMLVKLVEKCDNRIVRIENRPRAGENENFRPLLDMMEQVSRRGGKVYNYSHLATHKKAFEKQLKQLKENIDTRDVKTLLEAVNEDLGNWLEPSDWTKVLCVVAAGVAGTAFAVGQALVR